MQSMKLTKTDVNFENWQFNCSKEFPFLKKKFKKIKIFLYIKSVWPYALYIQQFLNTQIQGSGLS